MASEEKKVGFFKRIARYFREMKSELKKVVCPTFKQVKNNTGIVIVALILVGVIIAVLVFFFQFLVNALLK